MIRDRNENEGLYLKTWTKLVKNPKFLSQDLKIPALKKQKKTPLGNCFPK